MEQSRRVFLGSTAALGSAAVIGGALLFNEHGASAQSQDADPVVRELRRQLRAGARQLRGARPGEGARATGAALAFGAVYARARGVDAQLKTMLRKVGRQRMTAAEIEPAYILGLMRDHGITASYVPPLADLTTRERVYDRLVTDGLTGLLDREAQAFTARGPELDKFTGMFRPVVDYNCQPIMDSISAWSGIVAITCSPWAVASGAGGLACSVATGALIGYLGLYFTYCD